MSSLNVPVCVYIQASKFDGNWTADSARKTGSEICSPQELIVTMAEGEIAEIANTMTVRHRGIPSECWLAVSEDRVYANRLRPTS
jgi:hypothetical protein